MKISPTGAWLNETNEGHCYDPELSKALIQFMYSEKLRTCMDLGCGDGKYVNAMNEYDVLLAIGVDGNPHTTRLAAAVGEITWCGYYDLTVPFSNRMKPFDLILSLEVGEHIPAEHEQTYLDNVVKYAKDWIILSWAIPGQTGDGHVNCKNNPDIAVEMSKRGFGWKLRLTESFRAVSSLPWFKNTLLVFKRI